MREHKGFFYYFVRNRNGMIGLCGVLLIVVIGLVGTMVIPKPEGYTSDILMAPCAAHWLGTDNLGLGDPTTWSWGTILKQAWGQNAVISNPNPWWWWLLPSLCIVFYVVCFNLFGTALNDCLNPKGRE